MFKNKIYHFFSEHGVYTYSVAVQYIVECSSQAAKKTVQLAHIRNNLYVLFIHGVLQINDMLVNFNHK